MAIAFASATRTQATGTYTSDLVMPRGAIGVVFRLNISAIGTTPTLDIKIQYLDTVTGTYEDFKDSAGNAIAFAQKSGTGTDQLKICPGILENLTGTNRRYSEVLPRKFRVLSTVGDAGGDTITYSLAYEILGPLS